MADLVAPPCGELALSEFVLRRYQREDAPAGGRGQREPGAPEALDALDSLGADQP